MSTSISTAFITEYVADVHEVYQRRGGKLKNSVRTKDNVVGTTAVFQKIGTGTATTKARHGLITPMNQTHTAPSVTLADFYAGDWVDKLDEAKVNINERMALANGGAFALGRKVDDQILTALDATTQTAITLTVTSEAAIKATLIEFAEALYDNDVPDDGQNFGVMSPRYWSQCMVVEEFASADYVTAEGMEYAKGFPGQRYKEFLGIKWCMHTGVPGKGTATSKQFCWNKNAIGYATGASTSSGFGRQLGNSPVAADITWHGDRAAYFVNHMMSGGALLIDDTGVIEGNVNDTTAIATT